MEMEPGKLFVGGISWDTNEDRLREYFQSFGEVIEAVIMKDRNTGRARGFGFIVFANPTVADTVVREKHTIDGRTVEAKKAVPREDQTGVSRSTASIQGSPGLVRTKKIFVGGLASTVTETDFKTYFDQFGTITDVVVMYDHNTQRPRGFGFITYDSEEAVEKVLFKTFHELNGKMVEVKRAVPKELSQSPNRNQLGGGGYNNLSPSRFSSFLNAYTQGGYNLNSVGNFGGMRMDNRFSPINVGRSSNGYLPFGPSGFGMGLNFEHGLSPNFEGNGNMRSSIGYPRGLSPFYNGNNQNRFISPIGYGRASNGGGNGSLLNSPTRRNMWGNGVGGLNYSSNSANNSNDFASSAYGNNNIGAIWGGGSSGQGGGVSDFAYNGGNMNYRRNSDNNNVGPPMSSFGGLRDDLDGPFGNFNAGGSIYGDPTWRSASPELEGPDSFGFGSGKMGGPDVLAATNSPRFAEGLATNSPRFAEILATNSPRFAEALATSSPRYVEAALATSSPRFGETLATNSPRYVDAYTVTNRANRGIAA